MDGARGHVHGRHAQFAAERRLHRHLRGLEVAHAGLPAALRKNPRDAVAVTTKADVPLLYWTAAAWGSSATEADGPQLPAV